MRSTTFQAYLSVYACLLALATGSWLLARVTSAWALPIALAIGAVKALLVIAYFMDLRHESFSARLSLYCASALVLTLIALTALDVLTR